MTKQSIRSAIKNLPSSEEENKVQVTVQCFPLYSILLAVGVTKIDFFSLDIEGYELKILSTIPWDRIEVKVHYSAKHYLLSITFKLVVN